MCTNVEEISGKCCIFPGQYTVFNYIHTPFFSVKRQTFPRDLFRINRYLRSGFLFSVEPTVRSYTTNVPTYNFFIIWVGIPGPGCTYRPNMVRFSPRFFPAIFPRDFTPRLTPAIFPRDFSPRFSPRFFPAIFPRDFSPRFCWVNQKNCAHRRARQLRWCRQLL